MKKNWQDYKVNNQPGNTLQNIFRENVVFLVSKLFW